MHLYERKDSINEVRILGIELSSTQVSFLLQFIQLNHLKLGFFHLAANQHLKAAFRLE